MLFNIPESQLNAETFKLKWNSAGALVKIVTMLTENALWKCSTCNDLIDPIDSNLLVDVAFVGDENTHIVNGIYIMVNCITCSAEKNTRILSIEDVSEKSPEL